MKYGMLSLLWIVCLSGYAFGQEQPVQWRAKVERVDAQTYDLVFEASIAKGWALYASQLTSDDGPVPTTMMFQQYQGYRRVGDLYEYPANRTESWDAVFEQNLAKYHTLARFKQRIRAEVPVVVYVPVEYMSCNARSCLPAQYVELALDLHQLDVWVQPYRQWK